MIVFKTFLKILNKNKFIVILYTVLLITFTATNMTTSENNTMFEASKPSIVIINNDEGRMSENLINYLDSVSDIEKLDKGLIDDALFNRQIHYVIYIPENYSKEFLNGNNPELEIKKVDSYNSALAEMELSKYIKIANEYQKEIENEDELINKINDTLSKEIDVEVISKLDSNTLSKVSFYYNFLSYSILASLLYIICLILSNFRAEKIRKRNIISSMNYKMLNRQLLLSNIILSICLWILYVIFSLIILGNIMFSVTGLFYILNSFIFMICATTLAFLIGNILNSKGAISGIVNVLALGSSFLCGVFVPLNMLPKFVILLSHVIPTYWYVQTNDLLTTIEAFNFNTLKPIFINMVVLILFSVLFSIISNIIYNKKRKLD